MRPAVDTMNQPPSSPGNRRSARARRAVGVRLAAALLVAAAGPSLAAGTGIERLPLRLEWNLTPASPPADGAAGSPVVRFGVSDLERRLARAQTELLMLLEQGRMQTGELEARERLIADLQGILLTQDEAIGVLREAAARPAPPAQAPAATAPPPEDASAASRVSAPAVPVMHAPQARGGLPSIVADPRLAVEAALGVTVLALAFWIVRLRRRGRPLPPAARASVVPREVDSAAEPSRVRDGPVAGTSPVPPPEARAGMDSGDGPPTEPRALDLGRRVQIAQAPRLVPPRAEPPPSPPAPVSTANALREVDTLIAFESYEEAARLLEELVATNPDNPEYRLRRLHVERELGNADASAEDERLLAAMMDGPLSDTLNRVRDIGRGLLPGHPLFDEVHHSRLAEQRAHGAMPDLGADRLDLDFDDLDTVRFDVPGGRAAG